MNGIHSQTKQELFQQVRTYENLQLEHEAHEKYLRKLLREYQRELALATTNLEKYEAIGQTLGELLANEIQKNRTLEANSHLEQAIMEAKRFVARKEATAKLNPEEADQGGNNQFEPEKRVTVEEKTSSEKKALEKQDEQLRKPNTQERAESETTIDDTSDNGIDKAAMSISKKETSQKTTVKKINIEANMDDKVHLSEPRAALKKLEAFPETDRNGFEKELIVYLSAATKRATSQRVLKLTMSEAQNLLIDTEFLMSNYQQFKQKERAAEHLFEDGADQVHSLMTEFQASTDELVNQLEKRPFYQRKIKMTVADWQKWLFFRAFSFYCAWSNEQMPLQNLRIKWNELKKENR